MPKRLGSAEVIRVLRRYRYNLATLGILAHPLAAWHCAGMSANEIIAELPNLPMEDLRRIDAQLHQLLEPDKAKRRSSEKPIGKVLLEFAGRAQGLPPNGHQLLSRFEELRGLQDGWLNGHGKAPDKTKLDRLAAKFVEDYPEKLPLPAIVPTPEGNLLFEWQTKGEPSVDLDLTSLTAQFHAFSGAGDIEQEFDLAHDSVWPDFFAFLSSHIQPGSA